MISKRINYVWRICWIAAVLGILGLIFVLSSRSEQVEEQTIIQHHIKTLEHIDRAVAEFSDSLEMKESYLTPSNSRRQRQQLRRLVTVCRQNQRFGNKAKSVELRSELTEISKQIDGMCEDLTSISKYGVALSQAIFPVASIRPLPHRLWERLPGYDELRSYRIGRARNTTTAALRDLDNSRVEYPYHKEFQNILKKNNFMVEHSEINGLYRGFWINYVDLDGLRLKLRADKVRLCGMLEAKNSDCQAFPD